ncbi:MAG: hypothetical protein AAF497_07255 [Planctomycetota bacterium]
MQGPHWNRNNEPDEVDQLMLNARLRDELEPFQDESTDLVNVQEMPTSMENEYLASMLAWERAPVLPIAQWFEPQLKLPHPDHLNGPELKALLWQTIDQLYEKQIVLDFTGHLSDFELYCLIMRDILPSPEKKLSVSSRYLHWHCLDPSEDTDTWLRFYASKEEREGWEQGTGQKPPPMEPQPFPRQMPRRSP